MSFIKRILCKLEKEEFDKKYKNIIKNSHEKAVEIPPDYDEWLSECYKKQAKENFVFGD